MNRRFAFVPLALCLSLCVSLVPAADAQTQTSTAAALPRLIRFGGMVKDLNGHPLTGIVGVTFALYSGQTGGAPLWLETQNVTADTNGHYTAVLGLTKPDGLAAELFTSVEARWVGVQVSGQVEQTRVLLVSAPYAFKAGDAETLGGLPLSAFVLAAPAQSPAAFTAMSTSTTSQSSVPPPAGSITGTGTVGYLPLWDTTSDIISSVLFQSGTGSTAKIGINTSTPASTLDVKGGSTVRGILSLPATGVATATKGSNSQPLNVAASAFNSGTSVAANQTFQWQAEPVGNNTSAPSGTLNLLFGEGTTKPSETGLYVASNGQIKFATGQTFPGTGSGTVTSVASGSGLTGGPITGSGTISIANAGVTNAMLANPSLSVTAGTGLTGGGTVALGGSTTLNLDTTRVPLLSAANTFTATQTVSASTGNGVSATANGSSAIALVGGNLSPSGNGYGVYGYSFSATGTGVAGNGNGAGVSGVSNSTSGSGLVGVSSGSGGFGVYGSGANTGVYGTGNGSGVTGNSNSVTGSGVVGVNFATGGNGVYGQSNGTASGSTGVFGNANTVPSNNSAPTYGVYGVTSNEFTGSAGVYGYNSQDALPDGRVYGVYGAVKVPFGGAGVGGTGPTISGMGTQNAPIAAGVWGDADPNGIFGVFGTADDHVAVAAINSTGSDTTTATLFAQNYSATAGALVFSASGPVAGGACTIDVSGNLHCTGTITPTAPTSDGRQVKLYGVASPENWFEDFGSAQLSGGSTVVSLDPTYASTVNTAESYHVFLTPNGDCKGLYVASKTASGFEVREMGGGASSISFDYRIVAKRRGYESARMEDVTEQIDKMRQNQAKPQPKNSGRTMSAPPRPAAPVIAHPASPQIQPATLTSLRAPSGSQK